MPELYKEGKPLTPEGLFQLLADEVYRDGVIEEWEASVLTSVARFLKLDAKRAREIARISEKRFKTGELGNSRPLEPLALYEQALRLICSDGEIDIDEARMLRNLRGLFNIDDYDHDEIFQQIAHEAMLDRSGPS